jgi:hypothetical protein
MLESINQALEIACFGSQSFIVNWKTTESSTTSSLELLSSELEVLRRLD